MPKSAIRTIDACKAQGEVVFIYAGSHNKLNDLANVLNGAALLLGDETAPKARFFMIGDGLEKPGLMRQTEQAGLSNVTFHDPVPKREIRHVLRHADVGLIAFADIAVYRFGIRPNKMFDYYAAGLPVLLLARYAADVTEDRGAGWLVEPGNPVALAEAIRRLASLAPGERAEAGRRGRSLVEDEFNTRTTANNLAIALGLR